MEQNNSIVDADLNLMLRRETLSYLQDHNLRTYNDLDTLDNKARAQIAAASLFLGFIGAFQVFGVIENGTAPIYFLILLIIVLALYAAMIVSSIIVILPVEYAWPVAAEWESVAFYWDFESEQEYTEQLISDYIKAISLNQAAVDKKARVFRISGLLFGLIVIILVAMVAIRLSNGF